VARDDRAVEDVGDHDVVGAAGAALEPGAGVGDLHGQARLAGERGDLRVDLDEL